MNTTRQFKKAVNHIFTDYMREYLINSSKHIRLIKSSTLHIDGTIFTFGYEPVLSFKSTSIYKSLYQSKLAGNVYFFIYNGEFYYFLNDQIIKINNTCTRQFHVIKLSTRQPKQPQLAHESKQVQSTHESKQVEQVYKSKQIRLVYRYKRVKSIHESEQAESIYEYKQIKSTYKWIARQLFHSIISRCFNIYFDKHLYWMLFKVKLL